MYLRGELLQLPIGNEPRFILLELRLTTHNMYALTALTAVVQCKFETYVYRAPRCFGVYEHTSVLGPVDLSQSAKNSTSNV